MTESETKNETAEKLRRGHIGVGTDKGRANEKKYVLFMDCELRLMLIHVENLKIIKNIPGGSNEKIDIDSSDSEPEEVKEERIKIDEKEKSEAQEKILDEDFNRAFSEMMTESVDARKSDKKPEKFDAAIPYIKASSSISKGKETTDNPASNVSFTLLARKGAKVTVRHWDQLFVKFLQFQMYVDQRISHSVPNNLGQKCFTKKGRGATRAIENEKTGFGL